MLDLLLIVVFCVLGVLLGIVTGLLPGLHVNNVALIMLSASSAIVSMCSPLFSYGISEQFILILIAGFMISVSISHSFHDTIPTTFIGAPEEETALSVLPAHSLTTQGRRIQSSRACSPGKLRCYSCLHRISLSSSIHHWSPALVVYRGAGNHGLGAHRNRCPDDCNGKNTNNRTRRSRKTPIGCRNACLLRLSLGCPEYSASLSLISILLPLLGLPAPVLFPAFAGLFGVPTLLNSVFTKPAIPEQKIEPLVQNKIEKKSSIVSILTGSFAGIFVSIIPGLTTATGTVLAMNARQKTSQEQTIVTLSSVNTAATFSVTVMLFVILRARSGVTIAVSELIAIEPWQSLIMPAGLIYLLMFLVLSGALSYFLTLYLGRLFAKKFHAIPYQTLVVFTLVFVFVLVVLFTGILGLVVLFAATSIGFLPICWGVRRSHCMGILLIPIILYFL